MLHVPNSVPVSHGVFATVWGGLVFEVDSAVHDFLVDGFHDVVSESGLVECCIMPSLFDLGVCFDDVLNLVLELFHVHALSLSFHGTGVK